VFPWISNQGWRTGYTVTLYWIPKLHKCSYKQRYIAGSAKCSTKPLSKLLTFILSAVKTGLQSCCDSSYTRFGVNQIWILKNSKGLLGYIEPRSLSSWNSIKPFDFSTLYTTISHYKLQIRLKELGQLCFIIKNGQHRYKYLVLGRDKSYFVTKTTLVVPTIFSETDVIKMVEVVIDSIICLMDAFSSTDSRHTYGHTLCSSSHRLVSLFVRSIFHTGASQENTKRIKPDPLHSPSSI